ncbi:universal stress protein [Streptomyces odontomachi]|uniref:universal stress protein n=1 Tax=Streptomyces odontomachi TaxID=2944940 RepID=UPI00210A6147|nr:universal stress protein [Streptomyces sp. ODS25]
MRVIVWIVEGTWPACVDAAGIHAPEDAEIVLVHVRPDEVPGVAHGAFFGLLGRGAPERDPGARLEDLGASAGQHLLETAAQRLGRACSLVERHGRVEREVVAAAEGAGLLVAARDGERARLGPHSLGPAGRFVVDHAPCPVLLVWPETTPDLTTLPPHPPAPPPPPPPGPEAGPHAPHHPPKPPPPPPHPPEPRG